ncbi:hypothetical protein AKG98_3753 [Moritella sp. JT01]|uniref:RHS repeat protein n=1 Tax=Moritella sp. JT01 TaxID=756698 RepID=UPI0007922F79|nr:RHS repeat protein [Moritella sp. JT01]KXO12559.1 hypothetical protein AKG98_3753 [Moritella sp. JT01]
MSDIDEIVSNAFNFSDHLVSGPNPKTGGFGVQINLGSLIGNFTKGPEFTLSISYSFMKSKTETWAGNGWVDNIGKYDLKNNMLFLTNGRSYSLHKKANPYYNKPNDMKIIKHTSGSYVLTVIHKDGTKEYFRKSDGLLSKITNALGESLYFIYTTDGLIRSIRDSSKTNSITIKYDRSQVEIISATKEGKKTSVLLKKEISGGRLSSVSLPDNEELFYKFEYDKFSINFDVIKTITHPTLLIERLEYTSLPLMSGAPTKNLPRVLHHTIINGRDRTRVDFDFSKHNYLGSELAGKFKPYLDPLLEINKPYNYSSIETVNNKGETHSVKRTYNRFHLLTEEINFVNNNMISKIKYEYNDDERRDFTGQKDNYSLQTSERKRYYFDSGERESEITTAYDRCGNLTLEVSPSGEVEYQYYPAKGGDGPQDPHNFINYIDKIIEKPINKDVNKERKITDYTYDVIGINKGGHNIIRPVKEENTHSFNTSYDYYDVINDDMNFGLVRQEVKSYGTYSVTAVYTYELPGNGTFVVNELRNYLDKIAEKGSSIIHSYKQTACLLTGLPLEEVDHRNLVTKTTYNSLGKVLNKSVAFGTKHEVEFNCKYLFKAQGYVSNSVIFMNENGSECKYTYDGQGNEISKYIKDALEAVWDLIRTKEYDSFGNVVSETSYDQDIKSKCVTTTKYNEFNEEIKVTNPDGTVKLLIRDPVAMTLTEYNPGLCSVKTYFDERGLEVCTEIIDASEITYEKTIRSYDDWGNLEDKINHLGHKEYYSYDIFGRLNKVIMANGQIIKNKFSDNFSGEFILEKSLDGELLGSKDFDAIGRCYKNKNMSGETAYEYSDSKDLNPTVKIMADGTRIKITSNIILDCITETEKEGAVNDEFDLFHLILTHDDITGNLDEGEIDGIFTEYSYTPSGILSSHTTTVKKDDDNSGEVKFSLDYDYSISNCVRRQELTFNDDNSHQIIYSHDQLGRVWFIKFYGLATLEITYNDYGQIESKELKDLGYSHLSNTITTLFSYDKVGREKGRQFFKNGVLIEEANLSFDCIGKVEERSHIRGKDNVLTEVFTYSNMGRVETVTNRGTELPYDSNNNPISFQAFSYDDLGNIRECSSVLQGITSKNTTTYEYMRDNPSRLESISNSNIDYPNMSFSYDTNGNRLNDENECVYSYDHNNKLRKVRKGDQQTIYSYDCNNKLTRQKIKQGDGNKDSLFYFYDNDVLIAEMVPSSGEKVFYLIHDNQKIGRFIDINGDIFIEYYICNQNGSVLSVIDFDNNDVNFNYSLYGNRNEMNHALNSQGDK